ncbi:MAG: hypothetical protein ACUZ8I_11420 [Candidatus Scalindua sp.]
MEHKIKTRRERFEDVASKRAQNILDSLDILGNCANKRNYEFYDADIKYMFRLIEGQVKNIKEKFYDELTATSRSTNIVKFPTPSK